jgi:predicted glutamine amidotransferase
MSAGREPCTATFWLLDAPDSLLAESHRNPDGTGLGYFDDEGRPHVHKQPIAAFEDRRFVCDARTVWSRTFIAHVRHASTGAVTLENTHPFCQDGRLFAHNGMIEGLPKLEQQLGDVRELVAGDTDSERFFALITGEIRRHGGNVGEGIRAAVEWVVRELPVLAINFVLVTATDVWALRYPERHELYVLERVPGGAETEAATPLDQTSSIGTRVQSEHGREHPLTVIASERMDDSPDWRLIRSGELVHVGPSLELETELLVVGPPAHPLKLEELNEVARASQMT